MFSYCTSFRGPLTWERGEWNVSNVRNYENAFLRCPCVPPTFPCSCLKCKGRGFIGVLKDYGYGVNAQGVWESKYGGVVDWKECDECHNKCNLREPDCTCKMCNGNGFLKIRRADDYIVWEKCPTCNNECQIIQPAPRPTTSAPVAGGKSKRIRKRRRTRRI